MSAIEELKKLMEPDPPGTPPLSLEERIDILEIKLDLVAKTIIEGAANGTEAR